MQNKLFLERMANHEQKIKDFYELRIDKTSELRNDLVEKS